MQIFSSALKKIALSVLVITLFGTHALCRDAAAQNNQVADANGAPTSTAPSAAPSDSLLDGWEFEVAPYAWVSALSGTTGVKGVSTKVNLSIHDVLEKLDGGLMVAFTAKHDRWSLNTDFIWAQLSGSSSTPLGLLFQDAKVTINEIIWTETLGYTVYRDEQVTFDVTSGFRLASINTRLKLTEGVLPTQYFSDDQTWVDPVIGFKSNVVVTEDLFLRLAGDIGGFNAASALTWQALAALGYNLGCGASVGGGYRALGYDYNHDGFKYNVDTYGPFLGAEFKF